MRYASLLLFVSVWILGGCSNDAENVAGGNIPAQQEITTGDFYKRLTGTIAGKRVTMHLHRFGDWIGGSYYYDAVGIPISLAGWRDAMADDVFEFDEDIQAAAIDTTYAYARLRLRLTDDGVSGTWTSADSSRRHDVALTEEYPAGSMRLTVYSYEDSARLRAAQSRPQATASYAAVGPPGGEAAWLTAIVRADFGEGSGDARMPWAEFFRASARAYFAEYRADVGVDSSDAPGADGEMLNYSTDTRVTVQMNDVDWLVLRNLWYGYTGGVHGNGGSGFLVLDGKAKRRLRLTDVVADTSALAPFLDAAARTRFHIAPDEPLTEYLLVDAVSATENFYLTPTGLGFVYNPYEIAAYAAGEVHLFIPYKRIGMLLTEGFRQRMGLVDGAAMRG